MEKDLIPRPTARTMAKAYNEACQLIKSAFDNIDEADKILNAGYIEEDTYSSHFLPYKLTGFSAEGVIREVKKQCWYKIIKLLELPSFMPKKKRDELFRQVDDDDAPEITEENILSFCANIYSGLGDLFSEMVEDTAKWLQPGAWNKYKTNEASKFEIAQKVIKTWIMDTDYGTPTVRYGYCEHNLQIMDNVFSLLDGKGVAKYPGNLLTAIKEAAQAGKWETETDYFRVKWFKNGNMHIWFLREDLLKEFNKIAGEGKIKSDK